MRNSRGASEEIQYAESRQRFRLGVVLGGYQLSGWRPRGLSAGGLSKISGHKQFVTFVRDVNVNEEAARRGPEQLAQYLARIPH